MVHSLHHNTTHPTLLSISLLLAICSSLFVVGICTVPIRPDREITGGLVLAGVDPHQQIAAMSMSYAAVV